MALIAPTGAKPTANPPSAAPISKPGASGFNIRAENEHHCRDKQLATSNAQYAADKPDNDAKRKASAKVKSHANGDHMRVSLAGSGVTIAVKAGAPKPDISAPEALKATLLKAKSIAYSEPSAGGASGVYFAARNST